MGALYGMLAVSCSLVDIGADYAGLKFDSTEGYWVRTLLPGLSMVPVITRWKWASKSSTIPFCSAALLVGISFEVTQGYKAATAVKLDPNFTMDNCNCARYPIYHLQVQPSLS
ncbi:hypothetical protein B0H11DRAFT_2007792 [Mycena galericulata]|nr:hypothetical protein B0H11DRAFT_2007792 [Mycena galericulata]